MANLRRTGSNSNDFRMTEQVEKNLKRKFIFYSTIYEEKPTNQNPQTTTSAQQYLVSQNITKHVFDLPIPFTRH